MTGIGFWGVGWASESDSSGTIIGVLGSGWASESDLSGAVIGSSGLDGASDSSGTVILVSCSPIASVVVEDDPPPPHDANALRHSMKEICMKMLFSM